MTKVALAGGLLGVFILGLGFVYDVLFAGIPYPDPTPALAAKYALQTQVAHTFYGTGLAILSAAFLLGAAVWLKKLKDRR